MPRRIAALTAVIPVALLALLAGARSARAAGLDPFRSAAAPARAAASLDPFRVAQAEPAPAEPAAAPAQPQQPPAPAATPAPAKSAPTAAATPPAQACQRDEDCTGNNICQANVCQPIQERTNILYLYYKEGTFTEALLLYWSRKGSDGYTVFAPFYWHYWSPTSKAKVIAPFYWRFEDYAQQSALTVIVPGLPVSWSHQPGARSFAVWPLFYASTKFGWAAPLLGTFKVADPDAHKSFGAVGYLYWWRRSPQGAFDLGFPLFVSTRSQAGAFTYALPLNFYWRNDDDANTLAIPFFYVNKHKTGGSLYTWLGYHTREGTAHDGSLLWLYWFGGDDAERSRYDVFFPLVWSFSGPDSATTVGFPLFAHVRRGDSTFNVLFPVWWSGSDRKAGSSFALFMPFFYWHRDEHDSGATLLTLLGGYGRDDKAGTRDWVFWPALSLYHRDPDQELRIFTPLYVSHQSKSEASSTRLTGLLLYQRKDPEGTTTAFTPLFWHFRRAATGATATVLFPLFAVRSGPRDDTSVIGPFFYRRFRPDGWSAGLLPIAYFGAAGGRGHAVVFPLFWHFASEGSSTTAMLPLFYWHGDAHGHRSAWLPILLFTGNRDGESYAVQFPLLFHFASAREQTSTTATPLGYYHEDRDGWSLGVGPVLPLFYVRSGQDRSHVVVFPLFWHFRDRTADRTTTVAALYWHRRWGQETTDALFPLIHYRRGARPGGTDETSFTLFPLVHYHRDAETRVLATLIGISARGPNRAAGFVGPYFWYEDKDLSASFIPLLYADATRRATGERTRQYGPWFAIDGPGRKARVLFPLFGTYADARESDTWVFPSYFRLRRANGDRVDTFLPVFWQSSFGDRQTTIVGPYYDRTAPGVHDVGVVPLFFYARNTERTSTVIPLLLFWQKHDFKNDSDWVSCLLFYHSRERDGSTTALFPIYWARERGGHRQRFVFPIYWHVADDAAQSSWTAVGPVFSATSGSRVTRGILPLAWYTRDPAGQYSSNALLPLFYQSQGKDSSAFMTLLAGYRRRGPSLFSYVIPLWFQHRDDATDARTTVIPPLLYVSRQTPEEGLTSCLLLFWRQHDIASSTTFGLPLYYDFHEYQVSRTTMFLPLFLRYQRESDQNTYWFAPLFYRHSTPTDITMVGFPLVWDFKHGDERTTLVLPFYAHWRRPGYAGTYVFPTYYYRQGLDTQGQPDGTYRRFVLPFYDSGVKRPGDFMWEVFGGLVGHERVGHHNFLRVLYMTFETEPTTRAQTAWYGQPLRAPRKATPRGLNVAGF
jgi:hypothetical protein